jgi:hypothetical protein
MSPNNTNNFTGAVTGILSGLVCPGCLGSTNAQKLPALVNLLRIQSASHWALTFAGSPLKQKSTRCQN